MHIVTPLGDQCHSTYCGSLVRMIKFTLMNRPPLLEDLVYSSYATTILPWSRAQLALRALEEGATHLLWIDSDMEFPADMVLHWLDREEEIIGINALSRRPPFNVTAQDLEGNWIHTHRTSTGLVKAGRLGLGVVWESIAVIRKMLETAPDQPLFHFDWLPDRKVWMGEDYFHFERAKALGIDLWCDHDVSRRVGHVGSWAFNPVMRADIESGYVHEPPPEVRTEPGPHSIIPETQASTIRKPDPIFVHDENRDAFQAQRGGV